MATLDELLKNVRRMAGEPRPELLFGYRPAMSMFYTEDGECRLTARAHLTNALQRSGKHNGISSISE